MRIQKIGNIGRGQDGAVFGDFLFRFEVTGRVSVYDVNSLAPVSEFDLDGKDFWIPHSNCCFFGNRYAKEGDEFPVLYTNVYNNYGNQVNRREGVLLAYRIKRENGDFVSELVQVIEIAFTDNLALWKSLPDNKDARPYGNFLQDVKADKLWAFTMRDKEKTMRYIGFRMPKISEGEVNSESGVKTVKLLESDIISYFDTEYQYFIQGACLKDGIVYSLEGFGADEKYKNRLRLVDVEKGKQIRCVELLEYGCTIETEFIDFNREQCIYSDSSGNVFEIDFN